MKILPYNKEEIRNMNNTNILIICDNRNISYDEEIETEQYELAEELGVDLYPICSEINELVKNVIYKYYGSLEYWFIDSSLIRGFS